MIVLAFRNHDLNNLFIDYCNVYNLVKFNNECLHLKIHKKAQEDELEDELEDGLSFINSFYKINDNIEICSHYIKIYTKDIHKHDELAFRQSCEYGHLQIVKFLWSLNCDINIHANNEEAFRFGCNNCHLDVVKFLWSLNQNINVDAQSEHAYRLAKLKGHTQIVNYIISLKENTDAWKSYTLKNKDMWYKQEEEYNLRFMYWIRMYQHMSGMAGLAYSS